MKASIQTKLRAVGVLALIALLPGCGLFGWLDRSEDYRESQAARPLEVPPDLSKPVNDRSMAVPEAERRDNVRLKDPGRPPDLDNTPLPEVPDVELPRDERGVPYLALEDTVESAWRRTGLALERTGFSIESRDESRRLYSVRYAPPREEEQKRGFFGWLFGRDKDGENASAGSALYRVSVVGAGEQASRIMVLNASGDPQSDQSAVRILSLVAERILN